jgi:heme-degrading monooxygenase HmoA
MVYLVVRNKVKDPAKWKASFEAHSGARRANGSKGGFLLQNVNDPSETIFFLEWDDLNNAMKFAQSDDAKSALMEAGLTDIPSVYFLKEVSKVKH